MWYYFQYLRTFLIIKKKQLMYAISLTKGYHYTPFVILCEPRSGSTLLHTYLNSHSNVLSWGEILRMELEKGIKTDSLIDSFVLKPYGKSIEAVGLKLFYSYADNPDYKGSFDQIVKRKEIKIIHLVRKNLLELYVSKKIAEQTNVWSSSHKSSKVIAIHVDSNDYLKFVKTHQEHQQKINNLLTEHEILPVTYEELVQNPETILSDIQIFLGVEKRNLFSLLVKQNMAPLELRIANYHQLMDQLANRSEEYDR